MFGEELARWSEGSLSSKVAQGCGLLPVDNASETVGVVNEVTDVGKTEETESKEQRTKTWHDKRWKTHHTLGPTCDRVWVRSEKNPRMRACGDVFSVHASGGNTHWTELCPIEKDFMIQRSSKSLKQTSAHCKPHIVSHKHINFKSKVHRRKCGDERTTLVKIWGLILRRFACTTMFLKIFPTPPLHHHRELPLQRTSKKKFANEHLVTVSGPWMARPTSPQGDGYACGCSPGWPLRRSRSVWCGKCAASNGIACGRDNDDICAKGDDYTLSGRRYDAQSPKHVVYGATRASKTVACDATVVGVLFTPPSLAWRSLFCEIVLKKKICAVNSRRAPPVPPIFKHKNTSNSPVMKHIWQTRQQVSPCFQFLAQFFGLLRLLLLTLSSSALYKNMWMRKACPAATVSSFVSRSFAMTSSMSARWRSGVVFLWNIDMNMIRSVNFSSSTSRLCKTFWNSWRICNDDNPGKIFHSNSIAPPSIPNSSL